MIVVGIGTRRGVDVRDVLAAVHAALSMQPDGLAPVHLATASFKRHEHGLIEAANQLRLPLVFVENAALEQAATRAPHASVRVAALVGVASVAEAAALAAAGPDSRLLLARIVLGAVTCAIAEGTST